MTGQDRTRNAGRCHWVKGRICWEVSLGKGKNMLGLLGEEERKCWEMVRDREKRMGKGGKGEGEKEKGGEGGEGEGEGWGWGRGVRVG